LNGRREVFALQTVVKRHKYVVTGVGVGLPAYVLGLKGDDLLSPMFPRREPGRPVPDPRRLAGRTWKKSSDLIKGAQDVISTYHF
jgi:hypothetical protein